MEERTLYVGMDMRENKIQLCAWHPKGREMKMILEDFPLVIAIEENKKEWLYGEAALEIKQKAEGIAVTNFLELLEENGVLSIYGVSFLPEELLAKILKKALLALKKEYPNDLIKKIAVSLENPGKTVSEKIGRAFLKLGIDKDRLVIESHGKSFLCYALSQKRELWSGEIGLLDQSGEKTWFRKISVDRKKQPMIAGVTRELLSAEAAEEEGLKEVVKPEIATLYMTGSGFAGEEKQGFHEALPGTAGFLGESLYCEGACISIRREDEPGLMESFLFLEEESIKCDISIPVYHDAKNCQLFLAKASDFWMETGESACLILDEEEEIPVKVTKVLTGEEKVHIISLEGLWKRQPRMTKVLVRAAFADKNTCIIKVKDLGFGEFSPSSRRIWEKTITV